MEIISKLVKIEAHKPFDNDFIENKLKDMGINPLRWAIVKYEDNILTISLACENLWYDVAESQEGDKNDNEYTS